MMNTNPYQVRVVHVPHMFGRKALPEHAIKQLTKPDPVHLSVVGPRFSGKKGLIFLPVLISLHTALSCINYALLFLRITVPAISAARTRTNTKAAIPTIHQLTRREVTHIS